MLIHCPQRTGCSYVVDAVLKESRMDENEMVKFKTKQSYRPTFASCKMPETILFSVCEAKLFRIVAHQFGTNLVYSRTRTHGTIFFCNF